MTPEQAERSAGAHPLRLAQRLAGVYGHAVDEPPTYPAGVAFSGRLRLAVDAPADVAADIARLAEPLVAAPDSVPAAAPCLAVACFADELFAATGDPRHRDFLLRQARRFAADPDMRVEDVFFAGTLLGRAYATTGDSAYRRRLVAFLRAFDARQRNGLYWHCRAAPYFWGRGNAFAALGFAEALSCLDASGEEADLAATHAAHLHALAEHQDESGLWRQLVDEPSTDAEHSATTMIGYAIARGLRIGWLPEAPWRQVARRAWRGAAQRIGPSGEIDGVCIGTGPLASRRAYAERPFSTGIDARGGAMALWFAVEMARLGAGG